MKFNFKNSLEIFIYGWKQYPLLRQIAYILLAISLIYILVVSVYIGIVATISSSEKLDLLVPVLFLFSTFFLTLVIDAIKERTTIDKTNYPIDFDKEPVSFIITVILYFICSLFMVLGIIAYYIDG